MRTTINIDDDVLLAVQERARRERRTAGRVLSDLVSDLARQALTGQHRASDDVGAERHGFRPLPRRSAPVSNALIDRLREEELE